MDEAVQDIKERLANHGITSWKSLFVGNKTIWGIYCILTVISLIFVYSASSMIVFHNGENDSFNVFVKQLVYLLLGLLFVIGTSQFVYRIKPGILKKFAFPFYCLSIILLIMTFFSAFSDEVNGANRWISIFGLSVQPSEVAKLALILYIAKIFSDNVDDVADKSKVLYKILGASALVMVLVIRSNFSTTLFIGLIMLFMLFLGGIPFKQLITVCLIGFVGGLLMGFAIVFETDTLTNMGFSRAETWKTRIVSYMPNIENAEKEVEKDGDKDKSRVDNYQVHMAKVAIAEGFPLGKGPGNSTQRSKLSQAYCDFIYAIIVEETGLIGTFGVVFMFLWLGWQGLKVSRKMTHMFDVLTVLGLTFVMSTQAFIHMGVVVNMLPATGQTLPIVSAGGSSLLITSIEFGIILGMSKYAEDHAQKETNKESSKSKTE